MRIHFANYVGLAFLLCIAQGVFSLSDDPLPPGVFTGYAPVSSTSASKLWWIFYPAIYSSPENVTNIPLIIYLQGGPGSTSMIGNFFEHGRNKIDTKDFVEVPRERTWNEYFNILFIDHPISVGFSIADSPDEIPTNQQQICVQLYHALVHMFTNELSKMSKTDLYIIGNSYGGKFTTSISEFILRRNDEGAYIFPLKGIAVGDAVIDPINLLSDLGIYSYSMGLINEIEREHVELMQLRAVKQIQNGQMAEARNTFFGILEFVKKAGGGLNSCNFREFGDYDQSYIGTYLNMPSVKEKYGGQSDFVVQSLPVLNALLADFMGSVTDSFKYVLGRIPVMVFQGQDDLLIPTPSVMNWISKLDWKHANDFNNQEFTLWKDKDTVYGRYKKTDKLTFVVVDKAGHLPPYDQIGATTEMVINWINNRPWN
eukprot:TRINITY_DN6685_c0_g2_i3.p1 TRINITY_DN6685_c0_g2~~TRINITY_DN6685_c0_g2_i3.p1  ORF type:complete len:427 (-),score=85.89 TRINITY_DN6685_c0_g2_i3:136-1416(-)